MCACCGARSCHGLACTSFTAVGCCEVVVPLLLNLRLRHARLSLGLCFSFLICRTWNIEHHLCTSWEMINHLNCNSLPLTLIQIFSRPCLLLPSISAFPPMMLTPSIMAHNHPIIATKVIWANQAELAWDLEMLRDAGHHLFKECPLVVKERPHRQAFCSHQRVRE